MWIRPKRGTLRRGNSTTPSARKKHDGKPCHWCGRKMQIESTFLKPTRDHVVPKSEGGRSIVWACYACNHIKGDMSVEAWAAFMRQVPDWWALGEKSGPRGRHLHIAMIEDGFEMPAINQTGD